MTESIQWRDEFDKRCTTFCQHQYPGFGSMDATEQKKTIRELQAMWMNIEGVKERQQDAEPAAAAFSRWLVEFHVPNMNRPQQVITAHRTMKYGAIEQTYGVSRSFMVTEKRWLQSARTILDKEIDAMFSHFEQFILPGIQRSSSPQPERSNQLTDTNIVTINIDKIASEWKSGKQYIKAFGGSWGKHGVTIWDEVLKRYDLKPNEITPEGFAPIGWKAKVEVKDGHPRRVLELIIV